jgi:hypothetical protein
MAVNVDIVYKTVLSILNKEQRGYMTPQEFNKTATQVQLEIFEQYFDDLNQQLRVNQSDYEYADRVANIDEKMSIFKTTGECNYTPNNVQGYFTLPTSDIYGVPYSFYRLGTLDYKNRFGVTIGPLEELQKYEFHYIQNSKLTASTEKNPTFFRESNKVIVAPSIIGQQTLATVNPTSIIANYIRKPLDPVWGFTVGSRGQYIYNPAPYAPGTPSQGSRDFELHESEQTRLIIKILMYAGIIIKDPQIVQAAAQQSQLEDINSKS